MFANTKNKSVAREGRTAAADNAGPASFSMIGVDVVLTGDLKAGNDLHFDGRIDGDISCGSFVQGTDSVVTGSIRADSVRIAGTVDGSVEAGELTIEASARITGDVLYDRISIAEGASVEGQLRKKAKAANDVAPAPAPAPVSKVADAPIAVAAE